MTVEQLNAISNLLNAMKYTQHEVAKSEYGNEGVHVIKCARQAIPLDVCRVLHNAPDFDGLMTWQSSIPAFHYIAFIYKATK